MSRIIDLVPLKASNEITKPHNHDNEYLERHKALKSFYDKGQVLFGDDIFNAKNCGLINKIESEEFKIKKYFWDNHESIPASVASPIMHYNDYLEKEYPAKRLMTYPYTTVDKIIDVADKLSMIIVPLELVDLVSLLDSFYEPEKSYGLYGSRYPAKETRLVEESVNNARDTIKTCGFPGQLYIICPVSFYCFWNEITSEELYDKYYPEKFETVFTTIDLMLPSQRNLYMLQNQNDENLKKLAGEFKINLDKINNQLQKLSDRVTIVEQQIKELKKQAEIHRKELQAQKKRQKEFEEWTKVQLEQMRYRYLDPMIFFTTHKIEDFSNVGSNLKAFVVSCFGPEFPAQFFALNSMDVYPAPKGIDMKKIVIEEK